MPDERRRKTTPDSPAAVTPFLDLQLRWKAGQALLALAVVMALLACLRPIAPATPGEIATPLALRVVVALALGAGVVCSAFLASLRGRGWAEQMAFYAFLLLALDGLGQYLAPTGWPVWPLMLLVVAAVAVAEPWPRALALAALVTLLALVSVEGVPGLWHWGAQPLVSPFKWSIAIGVSCLALVLILNRALRGEKGRLAAALAELTRLQHGIDQLDDVDPEQQGLQPGTTTLSLRQVSEDGRRSRQMERAAEVDESLAQLVRLAWGAIQAHAVVYFDVDRKRDSVFLRAAEGPDSLVRDAIVPLTSDPFGFVLDRNQTFYATDFPRLLGALPYYQRGVRIGSLLAVPVRLGDLVCGILIADRLEIQTFTGNEPALLDSFAEMASRIIQRVRESGSREDMGTEFKAVYAVSRSLARLGETRPLRRLLIRSARELVPAVDSAAVVSCDESGTRYVVEADALGWPRQFEGREVGLSERTWAAWVLRGAEEPYLLDHVAGHRDRMPILVLDEGASMAESLLVLPLRAGDRNLGALVLLGKRGTFDATILRVLGILANQAAAALATIGLVERNKQLAIRDGLTRLYNRRAFDEALYRAIAQEDRKDTAGQLAILLLDLDHFKRLNDTFGHQAGDEALRNTAQTLTRHLRKGDLAARYGGEEFVVILPGSDRTGAVQLAERVRAALQKASFVFEGARISATASLGVALWPEDGREAESLLGAADRALYAAKESGRNRVVTADTVPAPPAATS